MRITTKLLHAHVFTLGKQDAGLHGIVVDYGPPPLWARPTGFTTLAKIILEQQVSFSSAATLYKRLAKQVPGGFTPSAITDIGTDGLRTLGITRQKAGYIVGLAENVSRGSLNFSAHKSMTDAEVHADLVRMKGIGEWTANVYLLMALRRPDIWPPGDLALHIALRQLLNLPHTPSSADAAIIAQRWAPYRAVAARILWHGYISRIRSARIGTTSKR